eukprot:9924786-Alexandrium_andersonii.AAC.1
MPNKYALPTRTSKGARSTWSEGQRALLPTPEGGPTGQLAPGHAGPRSNPSPWPEEGPTPLH